MDFRYRPLLTGNYDLLSTLASQVLDMFDSFRYAKPGEKMPSAAERKRNRDRQAQQKFRERKNERIQQLEEQVAQCEQNHGSRSMEPFLQRLRSLEHENSALREKWQKLRQAATSVHQTLSHASNLLRDDDTSAPATSTPEVDEDGMAESAPGVPDVTRITTLQLMDLAPVGLDSIASSNSLFTNDAGSSVRDCSMTGRQPAMFLESDGSSLGPQAVDISGITDSEGSTSLVALRSVPKHGERTRSSVPSLHQDAAGRAYSLLPTTWGPMWASLPNSDLDHPLSEEFSPWFAMPHAVVASPMLPEPLDLLHGSRTNYLADEIHKALRKSRVGESERLAKGWLLYVFSKWRMCPSKQSFELIPSFLRPTREQLVVSHQPNIDMVTWPAIRLAMISLGTQDSQLGEIFSSLACCAKVRWPWGKEILETNDKNELHIHPDFYSTFTNIDGWGLTAEFIRGYTHLMGGMDIESTLYKVS